MSCNICSTQARKAAHITCTTITPRQANSALVNHRLDAFEQLFSLL